MEYLSSVTRFAYHNLCAPVSLGDAKLFEKVQSVACKVFQKIKDFF